MKTKPASKLTVESEKEFTKWYRDSIFEIHKQLRFYGKADLEAIPSMPKLEYEKEDINEDSNEKSI